MKLDAEDLANASPAEPEKHPLIAALLRGLVNGDWRDDELNRVLDTYARLSRKRRAKPGTGAYLDVRKAHGDHKTDKIVIVDKRILSTGEDAAGAPESNRIALVHYIAHRPVSEARLFLETEKAKIDPLSFKVNYALRLWVEAMHPAKGIPDRRRKLRSWKVRKNEADHLMEFFEGKTLRDIHLDTGREYYAARMAGKLAKGVGDPENLKDSPIKHELYALREVLDWFVHRKDLTRSPSSFDMPDFIDTETPFFTYEEMMHLLWACLGYDANADWTRTAKIPTETSRWLVRFFVLYFLTGTRYDAGSLLVWGFNDDVGCIDHANGVIWRNGRFAVRSQSKPKRRSDLIPYMMEVVRRWFKVDVELGAKHGYDPLYVIHDKNGRPPKNLRNLINDALKRSGADMSSHKAKHAGVTLLAYMGCPVAEIAEHFGNEVESLQKHYLHINWDKIERKIAKRIPLEGMEFNDLGINSPKPLDRKNAAILKADLRAKGRL